MTNYTFGFIGLGLIGGSIAKALRRVMPDCRIIAYNRSEKPRIMALNDGTANIVTDVVDDRFSECDYIFLCTPVERNVEYLTVLKDIIDNGTIITDVGSVKGNIHKAVEELGLEASFIGGHPMAGSEKTSYEHASDRLCENAYYAITPTSKVKRKYVDELIEIVTSISAIPVELTYQEHDMVVAAISHLPHLIAADLVNLVKESDSPNGYMKMIAAGGFKDITRIASSSPDMWEQICMTNNSNISVLLQKYIDMLIETKKSLDEKHGYEINRKFEMSREYRDSFEDRTNSIIKKTYSVYCDIIDESGAIATIATILATNGISIKNIGIVHNREFEEGVLKIEFYDKKSADDTVTLLERHRYDVKARR
ncbi:MAG: prephenate dehydrogenase/arogenate dehydrogenase family protein [Lachnospiraceae bacterium]|nr:prephenate dehydrogenase/arogenate dehydrogenase family protein [Lachnospiraceae bacterium]